MCVSMTPGLGVLHPQPLLLPTAARRVRLAEVSRRVTLAEVSRTHACLETVIAGSLALDDGHVVAECCDHFGVDETVARVGE